MVTNPSIQKKGIPTFMKTKENVMKNYQDMIEEFKEKIIPQIFKADLLPGYTRATITQIEKHIIGMSRQNKSDDIMTLLFAYSVILGETLIKNLDGAAWEYEAPSLEFMRIKLPYKDEDNETIYAMPVKRVFSLYLTKNTFEKSVVNYFDALSSKSSSTLII